MAEHQRRVAVMDPPHITEFASERYFEKLNQLHAGQHQAEHAETGASTTATGFHASSASRFTLPLRDSKPADVDAVKPADAKRDKSRFFSIRQKVSLLHSKSDAEPAAVAHSRASAESARKSIPLDQLLLALPRELQIQIIASLSLTDILNLRLASKTWHALITINEAPIVRYHLDHHMPAYASRLYPLKDSSDINFHYLCSMSHRLHVAAKLSYLMCEWITKDIFLRQTEAQRLAFAPQSKRMRRRLIPLLFTVFHFFETHRELHLRYIAENGNGLLREPYTVNPIETQVMNMYDNQTLLRVHEVFPLIISSFCRRLRPPTYVGRVERSLRGYLRERPPDKVHAAILCLGGLREVERLWETKGYNNRRAAVDVWFGSLAREPVVEAPTRGRLGLKSFGRKKSTSSDRPSHRSSFSDGGRRSPWGSVDSTHNGGFVPYSVFNTSLSADAPMAPLEREQAKTILGDLPSLQQIWLTTAEAMILDRKIVQRPQDIKRNQQVMLDLIREDGVGEEDEWCYGSHISDSVRPPAAALYDDAD
ncbi:cyclin-like f-box [Trichoderma cornu-damae]|uniref:Cyclin-like f-box n=1 Tax=Trichoderma cornu-damae TaxID=654480 RepID=A0A9P8TZH6_9HYPO|nr:cyclin-like f-box [Trichoderma cornu-damae]